MSEAGRPAVFITGQGLASALGPDLHSALAALHTGGRPPGVREVNSSGLVWPVHALTGFAGDSPTAWWEAAQRVVTEVVAQCGAVDREGALFVASSSRDIGAREQTLDFSGDIQMFADTVARWLHWRGPVFTVSTACTSSSNALLQATRWLEGEAADSALVLGIELPNDFTLAGFGALQLLAPADPALREIERHGMILGQAVAALHLRAGDPGADPGRVPRWRIAGGANVVDGRDPAGVHPEAVRAACEQALRSSGIGVGEVDLLKPHAALDHREDDAEMAVLRALFGTLPPLMTFKHGIGHTLGAAGAAELALLMACVDAGLRPHGTPEALRHVLLMALGFGGGHAALVLERCA